MSMTLADVERRVRYHLRDRNPEGGAFSSPEYMHAIDSAIREVAGQLLLGDDFVANIVTLVGGTAAYTLVPPETNQTFEFVRYLKCSTQAFLIEVVSPEAFQRVSQGDTTTSVSHGYPQVAMFREGSDQTLQLVFWPTPSVADVVNGYRTMLPARYFVNGQSLDVPDNIFVPFDDEGFNALCYRVAGELFNRMPDDVKQRLGVASSSSKDWGAKAASLIAASRRRRIYQKLTSGGNRGGRRW